ncbi:MAG TPA: SUMF1/EgtB/PvdO family nonheme iron enzyme [Stellaceae bacterium]|nr:SUMF1/EgtB/PvdO family nonheme iron enzyme [Stellaceae bacterium]
MQYAARAGTTTAYYWGDNIDDGCAYENIADQSMKNIRGLADEPAANCDDGFAHTAPVGSFKPNPWGFYDILGNVAVWTEDCYIGNYRNAPKDGSAVTAGDCAMRAAYGGSWRQPPRYVRAAARAAREPNNRIFWLGVRLVRIPP